MLWSLRSDSVQQVYNAWNTCIKLAWQVPRNTHNYFVDGLLDCNISHIRSDIFARHVKFFRSLQSSPSPEVRVVSNMVSRDLRTTTGDNLALIEGITGLNMMTTTGRIVRETMRSTMKKVPNDADLWRIPYLQKMLFERGERYHLMEDTQDLTEIINSV